MLDDVGLEISFAFADQPRIQRTWTWKELMAGEFPDWLTHDPPRWLKEAEIALTKDPVTVRCSALVPAGLEAQAKALLNDRGYQAP